MSWFSWPVASPAVFPVVTVSPTPASYGWGNSWAGITTSVGDPYMSGSRLYGSSMSGNWSGASSSSW
eukprot:CAMPEP_0184438970 /NCGR_PEP_ID=MMETSP0738-20130409/686051_1 /TAXON_ID=385413 /ORGANISM="Thalassiosira miniscula, Strain CCMP1093" /LENGTH=66 /DNA_ID=CAMNT_0026806489 /DNA_START=33 /DNA_END=230 /DNA_ORIENTATION=-